MLDLTNGNMLDEVKSDQVKLNYIISDWSKLNGLGKVNTCKLINLNKTLL